MHVGLGERAAALQRAIPPLAIGGPRDPDRLGRRPAPDPRSSSCRDPRICSNLLPSRVRRFAVPATVLALVAAYPYFIQQQDYQRFLFNLPVSTRFRAWTDVSWSSPR